MNVSKGIIRILEKEEVDHIFTLMSEEIISLISEIEEDTEVKIQDVHSRHEQAAAGMADGYARASGNIGVCIVGRGPAIAQTGTSLLTARKSGSKTLYIVPEPPLSSTFDSKNFNQEQYLDNIIGNVISIRDKETLVPKFRDAFRQLRAGSGPIAVQIPWDILEAKLCRESEFEYVPSGELSDSLFPGSRVEPSEDAVETAIDLYSENDKRPPVIIVGRGAVQSDSKQAIDELAESIGALLVTTIQARGYFSDHPYCLGYVGGLGMDLANQYLQESPFVLALGCSLNPHTTDSGSLIKDESTLIQVDSDASSFNRHTVVDFGIEGDVKATVEALTNEIERRNIDKNNHWSEKLRKEIEETPRMNTREFPPIEGTMDPRDLINALDDILPSERLIVHDAGHFITWVLSGITVNHPDDQIWTLDTAAIGQGLPIALGAATATTDRSCIVFCGDAGFMMTLPEVETAVRHEIPLTLFVINDEGMGAEYHKATDKGYSGDSAIIESKNIAEVANSLGAEGHTVRSLSDVKTLHGKLSEQPSHPLVIDCKVNRNVKNRSYLD